MVRLRSRRGFAFKTAAASFAAGMLTMAALTWNYRDRTPALSPTELHPAIDSAPIGRSAAPDAADTPPTVLVPETSAVETPAEPDGAVATLRHRDLALPVDGVSRADLRDTFHEVRGAGRPHEAMDILAPRGTAVSAIEDGTIAKLFLSKLGGITIYQFDPSKRFAYYYAHLDRYAAGLEEGESVRRGQVLGYVGTSGNAPKDTPHLHFAVFELTAERQWWKGTAVDPFQIFR